MKKFAWAVLFFCSCLDFANVKDVSASTDLSLPFHYSSYVFTDKWDVMLGGTHYVMFFNASSGSPYTQINTVGGHNYGLTGFYTPGYVYGLACDTSNNCTVWTPYNLDTASGVHWWDDTDGQYAFHISQNIISSVDSSVVFSANISPAAQPAQLTINIDPLAGGSVTGSGISCNVDTSSICQYPISQVSTASLQANANCGYAFGGWIGKENPHAVTPSADTTITAKFYKTFPRNTTTAGYKQSSGYFGDCLNYVEYETELPDDVCTYSAVNCLGQAAMKGYATGNTAKDGAIVIYAQTLTLDNGHAAIVTNHDVGDGNMSIHDSNSNCPDSVCDGIVRERTVSRSSASIMGYIYPTP